MHGHQHVGQESFLRHQHRQVNDTAINRTADKDTQKEFIRTEIFCRLNVASAAPTCRATFVRVT